MTNLEIVREACIKANPEINVPIVLDCTRDDCTHALHTTHTPRPIRLADVLKAYYWLEIDTVDQPRATEDLRKIVYEWYLTDDDLSHQSAETLAFLAGLLGNK